MIYLWFPNIFQPSRILQLCLLIISIMTILHMNSQLESFSWLCSWLHTISSAAPSSGGKKYSIDFKHHLLTLLMSQLLHIAAVFYYFFFLLGRKWSSCSDICLTAKGVSNLHEGEHCVKVWDVRVRCKNAQLLTAV